MPAVVPPHPEEAQVVAGGVRGGLQAHGKLPKLPGLILPAFDVAPACR